MELAWALLLCLALLDHRTRLLALVLTAKWGANYIAFRFVAEWAPAFVDVFFGAAGVLQAARCRALWCDIVTITFVVTPLAHAWYWMMWEAGLVTEAISYLYYAAIVGLFSLAVLALSWPGGRNLVRILGERYRSPMARWSGNVDPSHNRQSASDRDRGKGGSA